MFRIGRRNYEVFFTSLKRKKTLYVLYIYIYLHQATVPCSDFSVVLWINLLQEKRSSYDLNTMHYFILRGFMATMIGDKKNSRYDKRISLTTLKISYLLVFLKATYLKPNTGCVSCSICCIQMNEN